MLLRNEAGTLPFPPGVNLAVIGPHFDAQIALVGDYYGQLCPEGALNFSCIPSVTPPCAHPSHPSQVLTALTAANAGGSTTGALGCQVNSPWTGGIGEAVAVATAADYVVLMLGLNLTVEDEGLDRHNITLPGVQEQLAQAIIGCGKPTVVVLINGGIIAIDWLSSNAPAIIEAFYPGFHGATAIASAIFGQYNPGGKMPVTMYNSSFTEEFDMLNFNMSLPPGARDTGPLRCFMRCQAAHTATSPARRCTPLDGASRTRRLRSIGWCRRMSPSCWTLPRATRRR